MDLSIRIPVLDLGLSFYLVGGLLTHPPALLLLLLVGLRVGVGVSSVKTSSEFRILVPTTNLESFKNHSPMKPYHITMKLIALAYLLHKVTKLRVTSMGYGKVRERLVVNERARDLNSIGFILPENK